MGSIPKNTGHYCHHCSLTVQIGSKHCWDCHKCVAIFDHHCPYLNTCIGGVNYRTFLVTIWCLFGLHVVMLVSSTYIFIQEFSHSVTPSYAMIVVIGCFVCVAVVILMLNWSLISLHVWLVWKGITTYEYLRGVKKPMPRPRAIDTKSKEIVSKEIVTQAVSGSEAPAPVTSAASISTISSLSASLMSE